MTISLEMLAKAIVRAYAGSEKNYAAARLELAQVQDLVQSHAELVAALGDRIKGGAHDGECDNKGLEYEEACTLHISAAESRQAAAQAALAQARALMPEAK